MQRNTLQNDTDELAEAARTGQTDKPSKQSLRSGAPPEDLADEPGAQGGSQSAAADPLPGLPSKDSSPFGDTDQHSTG